MSAAMPAPRRAASPSSAPASAGHGWAPAAALFLLALAILLAYLPAVAAGLGFVSDDFMILQRLRAADGLRGAATFFGQSYYDYYRPMGFVSFAADWSLWQLRPAGYHATSILLHLVNTLLAFLLARRLVSVEASVVAAALFGLHIVNHEAVFWASARFDLLATAGALLSLLLLASDLRWRRALAALAFLFALLSKESAVALPIAAGAYLWLIRRERPADLLRTFVWLGTAGVLYVWWRQMSGLPAAGGAERIPKIAVLVALPLVQLAASHPSTAALRGRLDRRRGVIASGVAVALASAGGLALLSGRGQAILGAFGAFGFATLHLLSPVSPDRWLDPLPVWLGVAGLLAAVALVAVAWRFSGRAVPMFLGFFVVAALLPVSSMTEGSRYLYLASVPVTAAAAWAMTAMTPRASAPVYTMLAVALIAFAWQVRDKGRDWLWASDMTARAVTEIVDASGPGCRGARVVLAIAPVRTRGVYANINHEALAVLGDCRPESFRVIIRGGYGDPAVDAVLGADQLALRVAPYLGGFLTSADFQRYATRIGTHAATRLVNDLGRFEAVMEGTTLSVSQQLPPGAATGLRWFVFGKGRLRRLMPPGQNWK